MHAAPPVRVSLGRSRGWLALNAVVSGLAGGNALALALLNAERDATVAWVAGGAPALAAWAWSWRAQAPGDLVWDGQRWQWGDAPGDAKVMIDLGPWMLLRFQPSDGGRQWIAASRRSASGSWPALRAALYSPRPADPLDPEQP
jgi:hypothetical protein